MNNIKFCTEISEAPINIKIESLNKISEQIRSMDKERWNSTDKKQLCDLYKWLILNVFCGNEAAPPEYINIQNN